jgi:hypothetical protein
VLLFGTKLYFVAFHSLCQSASREDSALALAREAVIRPLTDRPELWGVRRESKRNCDIADSTLCQKQHGVAKLLTELVFSEDVRENLHA